MKFNQNPLLLTAIALLSASGSIAQTTATAEPEPDAEGSTGCTDGTCWAACMHKDKLGRAVNAPDPTVTWEEGKEWCWLKRTDDPIDDPDPTWKWADCADGCDLSVNVWCDLDDENSCGT